MKWLKKKYVRFVAYTVVFLGTQLSTLAILLEWNSLICLALFFLTMMACFMLLAIEWQT